MGAFVVHLSALYCVDRSSPLALRGIQVRCHLNFMWALAAKQRGLSFISGKVVRQKPFETVTDLKWVNGSRQPYFQFVSDSIDAFN